METVVETHLEKVISHYGLRCARRKDLVDTAYLLDDVVVLGVFTDPILALLTTYHEIAHSQLPELSSLYLTERKCWEWACSKLCLEGFGEQIRFIHKRYIVKALTTYRTQHGASYRNRN